MFWIRWMAETRWKRRGFQHWTVGKRGIQPWRFNTYRIHVHPGRLTWNLRIHPWKRKIIFQTIIFRFYVNLLGCIVYLLTWMVDVYLFIFLFSCVFKNIPHTIHGTIVYSTTFSWIFMVNYWVNITFVPWNARVMGSVRRSMDRLKPTFFSPRLKQSMIGNYF